jgi:CHASE3 domain sensor protein
MCGAGRAAEQIPAQILPEFLVGIDAKIKIKKITPQATPPTPPEVHDAVNTIVAIVKQVATEPPKRQELPRTPPTAAKTEGDKAIKETEKLSGEVKKAGGKAMKEAERLPGEVKKANDEAIQEAANKLAMVREAAEQAKENLREWGGAAKNMSGEARNEAEKAIEQAENDIDRIVKEAEKEAGELFKPGPDEHGDSFVSCFKRWIWWVLALILVVVAARVFLRWLSKK